ncbi:hypothetical protein BJ742DRAFT_679950 [Cladochytrium replicatum]|nr:hypothetical protein BJ742DRAFT_679950 [Cladochytrium replicatum]
METEDDYKTALAGFSSRKRAGSAPATSRSSPSSFLNRILGTQLAITSRTSTPTLGTIDYSGPPPAAPSHIDPTDHLGLAIHYHEQNSLTHSALHLRRSAIEDDHPVGHYLYAMALRNGWGVVPDPHAAFEHLVKAVDASFALMAGAIRNAERRASVGGAGERLRRSDTDYPKGRLEDRGATRSFGRSRFRDIVTLVRLAKVDDPQPAVEAARAIVPLPIYEVGMSFRHGWGVPVCEDAAAYYLTVAANLGDADACTELGYCYLHGRSGVPKSRLLAAKYLREAEKAGVKLVGESWIHKRKWGGTV